MSPSTLRNRAKAWQNASHSQDLCPKSAVLQIVTLSLMPALGNEPVCGQSWPPPPKARRSLWKWHQPRPKGSGYERRLFRPKFPQSLACQRGDLQLQHLELQNFQIWGLPWRACPLLKEREWFQMLTVGSSVAEWSTTSVSILDWSAGFALAARAWGTDRSAGARRDTRSCHFGLSLWWFYMMIHKRFDLYIGLVTTWPHRTWHL